MPSRKKLSQVDTVGGVRSRLDWSFDLIAERHGRKRKVPAFVSSFCFKNGLFLAIPARFERATFRLGGGPSILLRYGTTFSNVLLPRLPGIQRLFVAGIGGWLLSLVAEFSYLLISASLEGR